MNAVETTNEIYLETLRKEFLDATLPLSIYKEKKKLEYIEEVAQHVQSQIVYHENLIQYFRDPKVSLEDHYKTLFDLLLEKNVNKEMYQCIRNPVLVRNIPICLESDLSKMKSLHDSCLGMMALPDRLENIPTDIFTIVFLFKLKLYELITNARDFVYPFKKMFGSSRFFYKKFQAGLNSVLKNSSLNKEFFKFVPVEKMFVVESGYLCIVKDSFKKMFDEIEKTQSGYFRESLPLMLAAKKTGNPELISKTNLIAKELEQGVKNFSVFRNVNFFSPVFVKNGIIPVSSEEETADKFPNYILRIVHLLSYSQYLIKKSQELLEPAMTESISVEKTDLKQREASSLKTAQVKLCAESSECPETEQLIESKKPEILSGHHYLKQVAKQTEKPKTRSSAPILFSDCSRLVHKKLAPAEELGDKKEQNTLLKKLSELDESSLRLLQTVLSYKKSDGFLKYNSINKIIIDLGGKIEANAGSQFSMIYGNVFGIADAWHEPAGVVRGTQHHAHGKQRSENYVPFGFMIHYQRFFERINISLDLVAKAIKLQENNLERAKTLSI